MVVQTIMRKSGMNDIGVNGYYSRLGIDCPTLSTVYLFNYSALRSLSVPAMQPQTSLSTADPGEPNIPLPPGCQSGFAIDDQFFASAFSLESINTSIQPFIDELDFRADDERCMSSVVNRACNPNLETSSPEFSSLMPDYAVSSFGGSSIECGNSFVNCDIINKNWEQASTATCVPVSERTHFPCAHCTNSLSDVLNGSLCYIPSIN